MDSLRFDGRVAIVTGAGRGLGRAHAHLLAARGAHVVVNDLGTDPSGSGISSDPADQVVREIQEAGGSAVASVASIATDEGSAAIRDVAMDTFGRIDILVNNAGIMKPVPFEETPFELFEKEIELHLYGYVRMINVCWPQIKANSGNIVNMSSAGILGIEVLSAYNAAKGAVFALTRSLALSGAAHGVRVNTILPMGFTRLGATDEATEQDRIAGDDVRKFVEEHATPDKVSPAVAYLSHSSCVVNGKAFAVGGGRIGYLFFGETDGYLSRNLTPEEVAGHIDEICDTAGFIHDWTTNDKRVAHIMQVLAAN